MTDGLASILTSETQHDESQLDINRWADTLVIEPGSVQAIHMSGINGGAMESQNEQTEVEPSEASVQTKTGADISNLSPTRAKKRKADKKSRDKIEEKLDSVHLLLPSSSKVKQGRLTKAIRLDEIKNYILLHQAQCDMYTRDLTIEKVPSTGDDILMKFEADVESRVKFSDFNLEAERVMVGKYSFPPSLYPILKRLNNVYGDVSATSKLNHDSLEMIYIMFCATIKDMDDTRLEQITEDRILKWRDVIKDALRMNFDVSFAMEHLKKIVHSYIGLMQHQKLQEVALKISALEAQLKIEKDEYSKIDAMSSVDAVKEFIDKPVSSGIFESVTTMGGSSI